MLSAQEKLNLFHQNLNLNHKLLKVTPENVFQLKDTQYENAFDEILEASVLPESKILNIQYWEEFVKRFKQGKSSLIFAEHKSNMDAPVYRFLLQTKQPPHLSSYFDQVCFFAGRKLSEQSSLTATVLSLFNRLIVVPKKEIEALESNSKEIQLANEINFRSNRLLREKIHQYIFWIFPTGTRSKIWDPSSYLGIPPLYNYLKLFDQMILISLDGTTMPPRNYADMAKEPLTSQALTLNCSKPINIKIFLEETNLHFHQQHAIQNIKSYTINRIIKQIYSQKASMPWEESWIQQTYESKISGFDEINRYLELIKDK